MNILFTDDRNLQLISRYSRYYIRFEGGDVMPIPCDYEITEAEKDAVLAGTISMLQVLTDNPREITWSEKEFMRRGFTDYLREECHFSEEQIEESLDKLDKNSSLRIKLYFSIMDEMSTVDEYMRQLKG